MKKYLVYGSFMVVVAVIIVGALLQPSPSPLPEPPTPSLQLVVNVPDLVPYGSGLNGFEAIIMVINEGHQVVDFEATTYFWGMWLGHNPVRPLDGKIEWEECNLQGSEDGCKIWWRAEVEPGENAVLIVPVMYALGEGAMNYEVVVLSNGHEEKEAGQIEIR